MKTWLSLSVVLLGCSSEAVRVYDPSGSEEPAPEETQPTEPVATLGVTTDVAVTEVALFQGVKIPLMKSGAAAKNAYATAIAGRPGLLRVYVKPTQGYRSRELTAELTLRGPDGTDTVRAVKVTVTQTSSESSLNSTINFALAAGDLAQGTSFKVRLLNGPDFVAAEGTPAQYPSDGDDGVASFNAVASGKLRVKLVPVRYNTDGSGRLPDTSAAQVERYRTAFFEQYPVTDVEVTVRDAVSWSTSISANGSGFDDLLEEMVAIRAQDRASSDVYYMGIFASTASFDKYCGGGCVTGLSGLIYDARDEHGRASVGIGWSGDNAVGTSIHEVGHAHGREHSPCNVSGSRSFPYDSGSIGSWGYGLLSKKLYSPSAYSDFMGYCNPTWISDYTYGALLTRVRAVAPLTTPIKGGIAIPGEYRFVQIGPESSLRWGRTLTLPSAPTNSPTTLRTVEANGDVRNITGYYYPYAERDGGYMLVRKSDVAGRRLEIDVRGATRTLAPQ